MNKLNVPYIECHSIGTIVHMAIDGKYAGHIVISDIIKPNAKQVIQALKAAGVEETVSADRRFQTGSGSGCR